MALGYLAQNSTCKRYKRVWSKAERRYVERCASYKGGRRKKASSSRRRSGTAGKKCTSWKRVRSKDGTYVERCAGFSGKRGSGRKKTSSSRKKTSSKRKSAPSFTYTPGKKTCIRTKMVYSKAYGKKVKKCAEWGVFSGPLAPPMYGPRWEPSNGSGSPGADAAEQLLLPLVDIVSGGEGGGEGGMMNGLRGLHGLRGLRGLRGGMARRGSRCIRFKRTPAGRRCAEYRDYRRR